MAPWVRVIVEQASDVKSITSPSAAPAITLRKVPAPPSSRQLVTGKVLPRGAGTTCGMRVGSLRRASRRRAWRDVVLKPLVGSATADVAAPAARAQASAATSGAGRGRRKPGSIIDLQ